MAAALVVRARSSGATRPVAARAPLLVVNAGHAGSTALSPLLFGLGTDVSTSTYTQSGDQRCAALPGVGSAVTLVRVGAATADDYDWRTDSYVPATGGRAHAASIGCRTPPHGAGATVLRVLDRARALGATAVVVLNGEIDDPQGVAGLVQLIRRRYGLRFARQVYWEIGNSPARWQHFGLPLSAWRGSDHVTCSPDQYAALVTSYTAAIAAALDTVHDAATSPFTPRIVADDWITNATDQSWTGVVTALDTPYYPFNSPDNAPASRAAVAQSVTPRLSPDTTPLDEQMQSLRANLDQYSGGEAVRLFVGQWNIDANPSPSANPWYDSPAQAVFVARVLLHLARDGVSMAAWAPPLYISTQSPFFDGHPGPGFHIFTLLRSLAGARQLGVRATGAAARLDVLAVRQAGGRITVVLVNAAGRQALSVPLRLAGGPAHPVTAAVRTFAPATPNGAPSTLPLAPSGTPVTVPGLGVLLLTID